jgi:hypothetical protein
MTMAARTGRITMALALVTGILISAGGPARADFHFIKITEVFAGTGGFANAQFVELQMYAPGQTNLGGHSVVVQNASGGHAATYTFAGGVANGSSQDTILVGTSSVSTLFGVTPDLSMGSTGVLTAAGGRVCFDDIDCVSWGNYSGTNGQSPANPAAGIPSGSSLTRDISGGTPGALEDADDTDNNNADFDLNTPTPRTNARITGAPAGGVIRFSQPTVTIGEEAGSAEVTVVRSGATTGVVEATWSTSSLGGDIETDIGAPKSGTLHFEAGDAQETFSLPITNDTAIEGDETIGLHLRGPTNGAALGELDAVLTITDNDQPPAFGGLRFSAATYTAAESAGTSIITVTRTGGSEGAVGVSYSAGPGGSATSGSDYTPTSGTLAFADGQTSRTFSVTILEDAGDEPSETVGLALTTPTGGAVLASPSSATLTITDNDDPPDTAAPSSRITTPVAGRTYRRGNLRSLKGTATDDLSGVQDVDVALRMRRKDGTCRWWNGTGFVKRSCSMKLWKAASGTGTWSYGLQNLLPVSTPASKVRDYTAYSRASDANSNLETAFQNGRNSNTFEIK